MTIRSWGLLAALLALLPMKPVAAAVPGPAPASAPDWSKVEAQPDDPACTDEDRKFMARANELARQAVAHGNEPFGALIVKDGKVVFENENSIFTSRDATQHAETGLVAKASPKFPSSTLAACTLYTSTEPCAMCCGAILWAGFRRVVYGTAGRELGAVRESLIPSALLAFQTPIPQPLGAREILSRIAPDVVVAGPLLEVEGLRIHESYWPGSPRIRALTAKLAARAKWAGPAAPGAGPAKP